MTRRVLLIAYHLSPGQGSSSRLWRPYVGASTPVLASLPVGNGNMIASVRDPTGLQAIELSATGDVCPIPITKGRARTIRLRLDWGPSSVETEWPLRADTGGTGNDRYQVPRPGAARCSVVGAREGGGGASGGGAGAARGPWCPAPGLLGGPGRCSCRGSLRCDGSGLPPWLGLRFCTAVVVARPVGGGDRRQR